MGMIVKICGLREQGAVDAALDVGADMVGFVFFEPSPRHVSLAEARSLGERVGGRAQKVALFVDADDDALASTVEALSPDVLQLHGAETPERVLAIRTRYGIPVMKAIAVATATDLRQVETYDAVCDRLLFDASAPLAASRPGGNGNAFDWRLVSRVATRRPWMLAGGLNEQNVADAIRVSIAHGVDVSSGVESAPGTKDAGKIARFVAAARAADEGTDRERVFGDHGECAR